MLYTDTHKYTCDITNMLNYFIIYKYKEILHYLLYYISRIMSNYKLDAVSDPKQWWMKRLFLDYSTNFLVLNFQVLLFYISFDGGSTLYLNIRLQH